METKKCILCEKELPIYEFHNSDTCSGGKNTRCISCVKIVKKSNDIKKAKTKMTTPLQITINKEYDNEHLTMTSIAFKHSIAISTAQRYILHPRLTNGLEKLI